MPTDARSCPNCSTPLPVEAHFCLNCGAPTPTEPGVPPRTMPTGAVEVNRVRKALADRYKIERVLGEGGMATVYLAQDLKHHRKVAVKVMRPELAETLGAERFLREVEIAASLNHPHILPVYDSGSSDGILYYVMPLVEGESLPARLAREKQLPVAEALRLTREVAEALAYAHRRGIVHRDIKPANILISEGHALVADFGIARVASDSVALTKTGLAIGTPAYMSPEQASGEPNIDGRTDIYALGCVLYEMIAGEPPFTGPTAQAIISRSITEDPRPLTRVRSAVPAAVDSAVQKALAKSPADRYATAAELAEALERVDGTGSMAEGRSTIRTRPRNWAIAALAILVLGAGSWAIFGRGAGVSARSVAVLPFKSVGDVDDAYFADGIVEELRDKLTGLDKFTVTASSSADQYRDVDKMPTEIARELRVDQLLMGTVRWLQGSDGSKRYRVTTELVDGRSGRVTWRETFDGDMSDPFVIQGRIAARVANQLGASLGQAESENLAGRPTRNNQAYELYLKARALSIAGAAVARERALLLEQAVALDSNFAVAWATLLAAISEMHATGSRDPALVTRGAEVLNRLQRLAPDSVTTLLAAHQYYTTMGRDQAAAQRSVSRALEINPRHPVALRLMALYDLRRGNFTRMQERLSLALESDPRNITNLSALLLAQNYTGQFEAALETARELQKLEPEDFDQAQRVAIAYISNNDLEGAKRAVQEMTRKMPTPQMVAYFAGYQEMAFLLTDEQRQLLFRLTPAAFDNDRAWWGQSLAFAALQMGDTVRARAYADSSLATAREQIEASNDPQLRILNALALAIAGNRAEAAREAERAITDTTNLRYDDISYLVQQYVNTHVALGNHDRALDAIEALMRRAYFVNPGWLRVDPMLRPLHGNPRFERLANRGIGTPRD